MCVFDRIMGVCLNVLMQEIPCKESKREFTLTSWQGVDQDSVHDLFRWDEDVCQLKMISNKKKKARATGLSHVLMVLKSFDKPWPTKMHPRSTTALISFSSINQERILTQS